MSKVNAVPFEFKIPAVPERTLSNVIPTGKQIPRTPIKTEVNVQVEVHRSSPAKIVPTEKPGCTLKIAETTKNWIPKGKEIPRTPIHVISTAGSSSSASCITSLANVDLGVQPLKELDENDNIDFQIEINILKGKINLRNNRPVKEDVDENTESASKENIQGRKKSSAKHRARCKGKPSNNASDQLCKEMESKCALVTRPQLKNICNEETVVRRNPSRRAKEKVNYKL